MKTSQIKIWIFVVIFAALAVGLGGCSKKEPAAQEQQVIDSELDVQQEVNEVVAGKRDRTRAERARARQMKRRQALAKRAAAEASSERQQQDILNYPELNVRADQLYQMALVESKIARKPMMSYTRMVNYCRQLLKECPNTPQADKVRELLRNMPTREQQRYHVTAEEMKLTE